MTRYFHNYVLIYRTVLPAHENALIVQNAFSTKCLILYKYQSVPTLRCSPIFSYMEYWLYFV